MRNASLILGLGVLAVVGCSPEFWGGGATGAVGTGAGYELRANQQMKQIEDDLQAGRIDQREADIRKDQIRRGSLIQ